MTFLLVELMNPYFPLNFTPIKSEANMIKQKFLLISFLSLLFVGCSENYSNGERIGLVTQFSKRGMIWKTYEGHLNITQTGMNSADGFDFKTMMFFTRNRYNLAPQALLR